MSDFAYRYVCAVCKDHVVVVMIAVVLRGHRPGSLLLLLRRFTGNAFPMLSRMPEGISVLTCGVLAVVRTAFRSIAGKVTRGSLNVAKLAIFWTGVFIAARFVLESN